MTGGPAWVTSDRFDLLVRVSGGHVFDADGVPRKTFGLVESASGRALQADGSRGGPRTSHLRFPTTARTDAALGPKARKSNIDCGAVLRGERPALLPGQGPPCGFKTPPGRLFANTFPMPAIASLLSRHLDRPVIDRPGFRASSTSSWKQPKSKPRPGPSDLALPPAAGPTARFLRCRPAAASELKLEPVVGGLAVIVIDQAERP